MHIPVVPLLMIIKYKLVLLLVSSVVFDFLYALECENGEVDLGWGDCNSLQVNDVNYGCMPSGCYSISQTTELSYSYLTLGEFPQNVGQLANLVSINILDCGISGEISPSIGNLENLTWLRVSGSDHELPDSLGVNSNLEGILPNEIGNLYNLEVLDLSNNHLSGQIPSSIGNLSNLTYLSVVGNDMTGEIPSDIMDLVNLEGLYLANNQLSGEIPEQIGRLENLYGLDISSNQLIGQIPSGIGNLTNLQWVLMHDNNLSGQIPEEMSNLSLMYLLNLSSNNLTGEIPGWIGNIPLWSLYLADNQFNGEIPIEMEGLELSYLDLSNNQLFGSIPISFCEYYSLDLSNNNFCPSYPDCIDELELGFQETTGCIYPGNQCLSDNGSVGFLDCDNCCWDIELISWLGDGYCDYLGGCGWEGPRFDCAELGFDCGDCNEQWEGDDFFGLCEGCPDSVEGDYNFDGTVNVQDLIILTAFALEGSYDMCGDINIDGMLNILDIVLVIGIIIG